MQPLQSVSDVSQRIHDILEIAVDQVKAIDRGSRNAVDKAFETAFRAHGGAYRAPELDYDTQSDEEQNEDAATTPTQSGKTPRKAASKFVVTVRDVLNLILILLNIILRAQWEAAIRVASKALISSSVSAVAQVSTQLLERVQQCSDYLHTDEVVGAAELSTPADKERLGWLDAAVEIERRATRSLAWLQLRKIGDDAFQAATQVKHDPTPPPPPPQIVTAAAVPAAPATATATVVPPAGPAEAAVKASAQPPTKVHAAKQNPPPPIPYSERFKTRPADEDAVSANNSASSANSHNAMKADRLLLDFAPRGACGGGPSQEVEVELDFGVPGAATSAPHSGGGDASANGFDQGTAVGRRNYRATMLLKLILVPSSENVTEIRKKIVFQSPTMRDWMSVLAKLDFNIVSFQIRSISQQIGESGPLLWAAAVDVCISQKYDDMENVWEPWKPDRMGTELLASNPQEKSRWVQLVQSEGCMRGAHAKQRIVTMAAKLLFPKDFEYYCTLNREDVSMPEDAEEWECISRSVLGENASLDRTFSFVLDRTSFITQAFRLLQEKTSAGNLTLDISEERNAQSRLGPTRKPDAYIVRIRRGDGTVLASQSSAELQSSEDLQKGCVATAALVPALFDALHKAAAELQVLPHYTLLKKSFDRVRLPVANEPREYIQDYLALVFGMIRLDNGAMMDTVEVTDQALAGLWTTSIRVGYPVDPLKKNPEFKYVCVEVWSAATKRGARNDALLRVGKINFAPEVLRMLRYGPTVQKAQAELILLVDAEAVIALSDPLQTEMAKLSGAASAQHSKAPGDLVDPFGDCCALSLSGRLLSNSIGNEVQLSQEEMELSIVTSFPGLEFKVKWDIEEMRDFYATLLYKERCFGRFVSLAEGALTPTADDGKGEYGSVPITGNAPIAALHSATRVFKEKLDGAPGEVRTKIKSLRAVSASSRALTASAQQPVRTLRLVTSSDKEPASSTCGMTESHYWSTSD